MSKKFAEQRRNMLETQLKARGIKDEKVLKAMEKVQRHLFVPENMRTYAYNDEPLPIGEGQTISQPYIVAYMTEFVKLNKNKKVLEIGTGSGYQTAILAEIANEVFTIEIITSLFQKAKEALDGLGYKNIHFKQGDGSLGWAKHAPYDAIVVTAAPQRLPEVLQDQLENHGRMIIPVGETFQDLILVVRKNNTFKIEKLLPVRFVPLISTH
ncbi:MAG: protein-L-isoaspartate(D-aspartate) O-methyltransferase [Candidatus Aminicenantes bacterium]|nr:protein-L-isoaspartate(D-aspartate) O-methyltransferase [Candidatus Aminicenantes bacterium]